ncbi:MAG TPA: hypothetical protein VHA52_13400 [Candidatus Babeliaceae bacterium]|nr:hypothetical protein [Candidatus Babeliaceae bacterium]
MLELIQKIGVYSFLDVFELIFTIGAIYQVTKWLVQINSTVLGHTQLYCLLIVLSYYANLYILFTLLASLAPCYLFLLFITNKKILQKNFVVCQKQGYINKENIIWPEELLRALVKALPNYKEILCVIERNQSIEQFLTLTYQLYAPVQATLVELLLANNKQNIGTLLVSSQGIIKSTQFQIANIIDSIWLDPIALAPSWQQHALTLTRETDSIVLHISAETHLCTVIMEEKIVHGISILQAIAWLKQAMLIKNSTKNINSSQKGLYASR